MGPLRPIDLALKIASLSAEFCARTSASQTARSQADTPHTSGKIGKPAVERLRDRPVCRLCAVPTGPLSAQLAPTGAGASATSTQSSTSSSPRRAQPTR